MTEKRKLIEVALPLEAINRESAREKSIRHGHPSTLHLWWARRPLAACRAVLFASLVDDPSAYPEQFPTEEAQEIERQRLFRIIEELVKWENTTNDKVIDAARAEIMQSCNGSPPPVLDPFCGGGSIPLEAQRLGLEAHASDLNPVAVLITKALIEIPPKFADRPPVHPEEGKLTTGVWRGAQGLAEDVRYYGKWMRDEAERRLGHLYPKVKLPPQHGGGDATVIAWIWARTVQCPNPACRAITPLASSFVLSTKKGRERWLRPTIDEGRVSGFAVEGPIGSPPSSPKLGRGANFACVVCGHAMPDSHLKSEGQAGRIGVQLLTTVAKTPKGRVYVEADSEQADVALSVTPPDDVPQQELPNDPRNVWCKAYGLNRWHELFTSRQLLTLCTLADLVIETGNVIRSQASDEYADAVMTYLAFVLDRLVDRSSTMCSWDSSPKMEALRNTFARQALPMNWDFAEGNPFSESSGNLTGSCEWVAKVLERLPACGSGEARQLDATAVDASKQMLFATDPPYYDNIGYADLSDFFYVWLRRSLKSVHPSLFSTLLVPKAQELVANPYRFGGDKRAAQEHFESGARQTFARMSAIQAPGFPLSVIYAFKQAEELDQEGGLASTGWETMLDALLRAGLSVHGTWPLRSELSNRMLASGTNALASSIALVCRPRPEHAPLATRKEFLAALKGELPGALRRLQQGNIAPVDLAQSAIGPGMGVFSRYSKVVEADGTAMTVRTALGLINQILDETL